MTSTSLRAGLSAQLEFTVGPGDTADALGSGTVPVLATPRLLAWAEAATLRVIDGELAPSDTTVGTVVQLQHLRGTPVGGRVTVRAELTAVEGHTLRFTVSAADAEERTVLWGTITRVAVDRDRFLAGL